MKTFVDLNLPSIKRVDSPSGRVYITPEGKSYPSVTSIVSASQDNTWLKEWREKVGEETANRISKEATDRGTFLHLCCEKYLKGESIKFDMFQHLEKEMFGYFKPILDNVDYIQGMELPLWSDRLECAGTVDLIAVHDETLKVIDWKNASNYKSREDIPNYFMQMAAYACMFLERTGIKIKKLLVVIAVKDYGLVTYEENTSDWVNKFIEARKAYGVIPVN